MTDQDMSSGLPPGLRLAWIRSSTPRRGPKPGHSVDEIVNAAIDIADSEGIHSLSLPRIAGRVGVTTNALYRYVASKDELLMLAYDAAWGQPPNGSLRTGSWRKKTKAWTVAVIEGYRKRPWLLDVPTRAAPMTPNVLRWLEVLLKAMADSGLSAQDRLQCALLLDGYARSAARLSRDLASEVPRAGQEAVIEFLLPLLRQHDYPILAALIANQLILEGGSPADDIVFGLERILDGIGVLIAKKG